MRDKKPRALPRRVPRTPIAAAILLACPALLAQGTTGGGLEEIVVTAQKRTENLQDVPISIQALGSEKLAEMNVRNFRDYVNLLPAVTVDPALGAGAGFSLVYMRGIATGGDGQATTSQPSVGMYLDEQPITTVQGNLDIHMYDIQRVEALAGPQGTLYGASSQAGTIRIITNKPDASAFSAGYAVEGNIVDEDDTGYVVEGYVNVPLTEKAAVRLVGWSRKDAGWVDNKFGARTFTGDIENPDDDITIDNAGLAEDNYNTVDTIGARAALRVELNDDWVITPALQAQKQESEGSWGDDLSDFAPGDNAVTHFQPEYSDDEWYQVGLTIEGSISNFDVVYSGNYLERDVDASFDYADYSYFYDAYYTTGYFAGLFFDNNNERISPAARYTNNDAYTKQSHELRISSPADKRVRGMLGFFWQKQEHEFQQNWLVEGLADVMLMNSGEANMGMFADTVYLNNVDRIDEDQAIFGSVSFDITDQWELTLGARYFEPENSVKGYFGFGLGFSPACEPGICTDDEGELIGLGEGEPGAVANGGSGAYSPVGQDWSKNGEWRCASQEDYKDAPCLNVDRRIKESEYIGRVNLTWKPADGYMMYATWSEGYRPGGINRDPTYPDYVSDFLTNWELGWKTAWLDNTLQFNGAVFLQEWDDVQVSFAGDNGITLVNNGPTAEVAGIEMQALWMPLDGLRLSTSVAYYDSELQDTYCEDLDCDSFAPAGSQLPLTPEFKGNLIGRYEFPLAGFDANVQGAIAYESSRPSDIVPDNNAILGDIPSSTVLDLSAGIGRDSWGLDLFIGNVTNEDAATAIGLQCAIGTCGPQTYGVRTQPRTIGLKFSQEF